MKLRQGKTKTILESSINSALLAVEVYNKPRTTFRSESYIALMHIAWMRLFHAYFNHQKIKYYYKDDKGRYVKRDGDYRYWELGTCLDEFGKLDASVRANLDFFIGLRNKIEHRHIDEREIDVLIFGECQSLLYNYENTLTTLFGDEYAMSENLAYSLQFSLMRTKEQKRSNKSVLSKEVKDVKKYVEDYRSCLEDNIFDSQEYSIKIIVIPKVSNTNRGDLALEFVNWNSLNDDEKSTYEKVVSIIKDKRILTEAVNTDRFKPIDVIREVKKRTNFDINQHTHKCLYYAFSIRPTILDTLPKESTNSKYCLYDATHNDYVYTESWVSLLCDILSLRKLSLGDISRFYRERAKLEIEHYEG